MKTLRTLLITTSLLALTGAAASPGHAQGISNGGFEAGFASWTRASQVGSDGGFALQTGTASPINGFGVASPPEGATAAMTDSQGPGSHVLYQDFVVPTGSSFQIAFSLFLGSDFGFTNPGHLDFATGALNQQARVDLMTAGSDAFSVAGGDVLQNLFQTAPGDPQNSGGYLNFLIDVLPLLQARQGQTVRLRFAEVDNVSFFNFGVDKVALVSNGQTGSVVPEGPSLVLAFAALLPLAVLLGKRQGKGTAF